MDIAVLCIGNELELDDGAGPVCGRYLQARWQLPPQVVVLDRAVMGMPILTDLRAHDRVLVIDAVNVPGATPGTIFSFDPHDAMPSGQQVSLHDVRFADVVQTAELMGVRCDAYCLGLQVENASPSRFVRALTPRVAAAVPLLAAAAVRWLEEACGCDIPDRLASGDPLRAGQRDVPGARDFSGATTGVGESVGCVTTPYVPIVTPTIETEESVICNTACDGEDTSDAACSEGGAMAAEADVTASSVRLAASIAPGVTMAAQAISVTPNGPDEADTRIPAQALGVTSSPVTFSAQAAEAPGASAPDLADDPLARLTMLDGQVPGPLGVPLPVVLGEPDACVMADYLARSLRAVGADGQVVPGKAGSALTSEPAATMGAGLSASEAQGSLSGVRVDLALPAGEACDALVARFGLLPGPIASETQCLSAIVTNQTTDYDCDALVGECLGLLEARSSSRPDRG